MIQCTWCYSLRYKFVVLFYCNKIIYSYKYAGLSNSFGPHLDHDTLLRPQSRHRPQAHHLESLWPQRTWNFVCHRNPRLSRNQKKDPASLPQTGQPFSWKTKGLCAPWDLSREGMELRSGIILIGKTGHFQRQLLFQRSQWWTLQA